MRIRNRGYTLMEVLICVMIFLIIALVIYQGCVEYRAKKKCTDNGGRVIEYNCRTTCRTEDNITTCTERCDWRCEGANAEARP